MRILLYSPAFLPQVGGLEINVATLAAEFGAAGHQVVVITRTPGSGADDLSYRVVRRPTPREFLRWTRWSDVFFQANVSLRGLWLGFWRWGNRLFELAVDRRVADSGWPTAHTASLDSGVQQSGATVAGRAL